MSAPSASAPSSGSPALRYGALFGLVWGVLLIANYYLVQVQGVRFTTIASYIIALILYLVAGVLASTKTGKVSTGLLAGLWTGLISSVVNAIGVTVILLSDHALVEKLLQTAVKAEQQLGASNAHLTDSTIIASSIVGLIVGAIVATVVGLGLGALGGMIGKSRTPRPPAPSVYQESMYRGLPPTPDHGGSPQ